MPQAKLPRESYENFGGINQKASLYLTNENDCLNLLNLDFQKPGSLSSTPGSAPFLSATFPGRITGLYEYTKLSGESHVIFNVGSIAYYTDGSTSVPFRLGLNTTALWDYVTFVDTLFMANGHEFIKYDGNAAYRFSAPEGGSLDIGMGVAAVGLSGSYVYAYGYLTTSGYFSGVGSVATLAVAGTAAILSGFTNPGDYGITAIVLYRSSPGGVDLFEYDTFDAATATYIDTGALSLGTRPAPESIFFTLAPRYLELFQNSLFMIGSSQFPSTAFYSELGAPETILADSNFEVRTNDGDILTGGKFYAGANYLFKQKSFSKVIGNDTENFALIDISAEYGSLSNRAVVIYNDIMLFLDRKGICRYNGATPEIISTKIEDIFLRMNIEAAVDNACAIHFKYRNQIWWGIPVDDSTVNNIIIIYDYLADSWTIREGFLPSSMAFLQSHFPRQTAFYGSYSGTIHYVSASLYADSGQGITYAMQTKFHYLGGKSDTMQYRRLFIDTDPIEGITVPLTVNFRINEQPDIVKTMDLYFDRFQTRLEFGIPAKSLSMEFVTSSASTAIRINGYTLEARLQRHV